MPTTTPALPSEKELLILELLCRDGEQYGLQLVAGADGALKPGTVYVTLGRMEAKGYLRALRPARDAHTPGLPRPRYRVTALGRHLLAASRHLALTLAGVLGS
jgi:DNA-binding PadR family transcriptional regulator